MPGVEVPIWLFRLRTGTEQVIKGCCECYNIRVTSDEPIPIALKTRLLTFFEDLCFNSFKITSVRIDRNEITEDS